MDGVLLLHKPAGMTSHDCVSRIRKILKTKKVGHTGTLDPDVSGVLPICVGRATKIVELLTGAKKTYEGEVTLGISTTTEDAAGDIVSEKPVNRVIHRKEIESVFQKLTGEIAQTPPMYSAVKVKGKKLYEYARAGIEVERPTRTVTIYELVLLDDRSEFTGPNVTFRFRVVCSKGTYVRTLAATIGEMLGFPSHMSSLVRTASGPFTAEECYTFDEIEEKAKDGKVETLLLSIEKALFHLPKYQINDTVAEKVKNGAVLPIPDHLKATSEPILVTNDQEKALALYMKHPAKPYLIKPWKVFG